MKKITSLCTSREKALSYPSLPPGCGSTYGRGYIIEVGMVTRQTIPGEVREDIESAVINHLRPELALASPNSELHVERDGPIYKIHGNINL